MKPRWPWLFLVFLPFLLRGELARSKVAPPREREPVHRSPIDLAILPGGRQALCANHTADSVSLVDLVAGKLLQEQPCGKKPAAVACSRDGRWAVVSNLWSGTITILEIRDDRLHSLGDIQVGHMPRGLVIAPDGQSLYVALAGADEVVQVDRRTHKILQRWSAPREPRRLALTRDGQFLLAGSTRSAQVRCWDTKTGKLTWERKIAEAFNLLGLALTPDDREVLTTQIHDRHHPIAPSNIEQGWALNSRLARLLLKPTGAASYAQIALDRRNKAVGDPSALAFNQKGDWLAAAAAGTQELLLIKPRAIPWVDGEPGDFLDGALNQDDDTYHRIVVGGRPLAVAFIEGRDQIAVANYLLDCVQVVDIKARKLIKSIALGGPARPSLARRGEAIFFDAKRSHHQWFSCHTCHTDGHTSSRIFDTFNDESTNTPKMTPTLRGVTRTGPWTWHGWQESLEDAVEKSLTETLWGRKPTAEDVKAVVAFMDTLEHPPNPNVGRAGKRSAAAERGKALFQDKARCARCHQGEQFTSKSNYDVKLPPDGSPFDKWNPPSLRGVYDRGPFLHDGKVETLDELLRDLHAPEKLGGKALTPAERRDLIEFLKTL
jgi:cytochrome c peroxidase